MDIRVYNSPPEAEKLEICRAEEVKVRYHTGTTPAVIHMGQYLTFSNTGPILELHLEGVQTPAPLRPTNQVDMPSVKERDLRALVVALVKMLGGSVIIHSHELSSAFDTELFVSQEAQPGMHMHVLTIKERQ